MSLTHLQLSQVFKKRFTHGFGSMNLTSAISLIFFWKQFANIFLIYMKSQNKQN